MLGYIRPLGRALSNVRTRTSTPSVYKSSICNDKIMLQPHVMFEMTISYRWLMTQGGQFPRQFAMTIDYISQRLLEFRDVTSYRPNAKWISISREWIPTFKGTCLRKRVWKMVRKDRTVCKIWLSKQYLANTTNLPQSYVLVLKYGRHMSMLKRY